MPFTSLKIQQFHFGKALLPPSLHLLPEFARVAAGRWHMWLCGHLSAISVNSKFVASEHILIHQEPHSELVIFETVHFEAMKPRKP